MTGDPPRPPAEIEAAPANMDAVTQPKGVGAFDNPIVERAKAAIEARKLARRYISPEEQKRDFLLAKRAEVDGLEALARQTLEANPCSESADEEEEAQWRELAHASRQMRPLLEAIERAGAKQSDYEKYKDGFDFRLTEAMATVARLCSHGRLQSINGSKGGRPERVGADALDKAMDECAHQKKRAKEAWISIRAAAEANIDGLYLDGSAIEVWREGAVVRHVEETSFRTTFSDFKKLHGYR